VFVVRGFSCRELIAPFALAASLVGCVGCGGTSESVVIPSFSAGSAGSQAVKLCDANGNETIDGAEFSKCPSLVVALPRIDQDGNGKLTAAEIRDRVATYSSHGIGLMQLKCVVTLNGQPLANAKVTLVPEEFLGKSIEEATGTTDGSGHVSLRKTGSEYPAVQPGLYRVRVSVMPDGGAETIPAQYNVETVLGVEVAPDVPELERGFKLDLKS
jgi:hypothetical protein